MIELGLSSRKINRSSGWKSERKRKMERVRKRELKMERVRKRERKLEWVRKRERNGAGTKESK